MNQTDNKMKKKKFQLNDKATIDNSKKEGISVSSNYYTPISVKQAKKDDIKAKELNDFLLNKTLNVADVTTDVMQLGNFIPHPIGQGIGKAGNVLGSMVDAAQIGINLKEDDYTQAAINSASLLLPATLGSNSFRRNSKHIKSNHPLYNLKDKNNRTNYIEVIEPTKHMQKNQLLTNRFLLGTLGTETILDIAPSNTKQQKKYKFGGKVNSVPIEVEGGEVAETPNDIVKQYQGASHEAGGIKTNEQEGTVIFSDRISIDGKSLAERKLQREKLLKKALKNKEKNGVSFIGNNTFKRINQISEQEEQKDLMVQEIVNNNSFTNKMKFGGRVKYANGTGSLGVPPDAGAYSPIDLDQLNINPMMMPTNILPTNVSSVAVPSLNLQNNNSNLQNKTSNFTNPLAGFPIGNTIGAIGTAVSSVAPLLTTKNYFKNRVKPQDYSLDLFKDSIDTLNTAEGAIDNTTNVMLSNAQRMRNNNVFNNNNRTRSLNTSRALNIATDMATGDEMINIANSANQQKVGLATTKAGLLSQRDSTRLANKNRIEDINRSDVESYYTALNKDMSNLGTGIQTAGKNLNQVKHNEDFMSILPLLSENGLSLGYDKNGKLKLVSNKTK